MRLALLSAIIALIAGCATAATQQSTPAPPKSSVFVAPRAIASSAPVVEITPEDALAEARARFEKAEVTASYEVRDHADVLRANGLDESRTVALLHPVIAACLSHDDACEGVAEWNSPEGSNPEIVGMLIAHLGSVGTDASVPLLMQLQMRDVYNADQAIGDILQRRAQARQKHCEPPVGAEVEAQRAALSDFAILEHSAAGWRGRAPTEQQLDDLAYFFASVAEAGAEVGIALEQGPSPFSKRPAPDEARKKLTDDMKAARWKGDLAAHAVAARNYLVTLGYPGPLRAEEESAMTWGGPGYANVMRDLAESTEFLGQFEEAAELFRRAPPGGGACGTSVGHRRAQQRRGLIRGVEQSHGCRAVVPERLFADRGAQDWYGPRRLADAGFDLVRLYRGAMLTSERDAAPALQRAALSAITGPLGRTALARYEQRGPEAWDERVRAIEGYADTAGSGALPILLDIAKVGTNPQRIRALRALGSLVDLTGPDPCDRNAGWGAMHGGSSDDRPIRSVNHTCSTRLSDSQMDGLARTLAAVARDKDPGVREAVARALGSLGIAQALPTLKTLLSDRYQLKGSRICSTVDGKEQCRDNWPVRERAQESIERIDKRLQRVKQEHARRR